MAKNILMIAMWSLMALLLKEYIIACGNFTLELDTGNLPLPFRPLTAIRLACRGAFDPATLNTTGSCSWKSLLKSLGLLCVRSLVRTNQRLLPQSHDLFVHVLFPFQVKHICFSRICVN